MKSSFFGGLVMLTVGVSIVFVSLANLRDVWVSEDWVRTPARLLSAEIEYDPVIRSQKNYLLRVRYAYSLPDGEFEGDRFSMGAQRMSRVEAQAVLDSIRNSPSIVVYRDPRDPSRSAMFRGRDTPGDDSVLIVAIAALSCVVGAWMMRRSLPRNPADRLI